MKVVDLFDLVIFGGTGDLAMRKLLPAMYRRYADGQIPPDSRIIGVARTKDTDQSYRDSVRAAIAQHVKNADSASVDRFLAMVHYFGLDATQDAGWNEPPVGPDWAGPIAPSYFNNRKVSIYGGSNEIQKNIIAKAVLGL